MTTEVGFTIRPQVQAQQSRSELQSVIGLLKETESITDKLRRAQLAAEKEKIAALRATGHEYDRDKARLVEISHILQARRKVEAEAVEKQRQAQMRLNVYLQEQKEKQEALAKVETEALERRKRMLSQISGVSGLGGVGMVAGLASGGMTAIIEKGIDLFNSGIGFIKEAGSFVVDKAKALYMAGKEDAAVRDKYLREFGKERGARWLDRAGEAGGRAGVAQSSGAEGLLELARAMPDVAAGTRTTAMLARQLGMGSRRKMTAQEADSYSNTMFERRAKLFERLQTLNPNVDSQSLGRALGGALAGPQGVRSLVGMLDLPMNARRVAAANESGKLGKMGLAQGGLTDDERKKYKLLPGGRLASMDLMDLILERGGQTEDAAEGKRKKLDFQIKSIKATLDDVFSDIGTRVFDELNVGLKKSGSLAERFKEYISSPDGKKAILEISHGLGQVARFIGESIAKLPLLIEYMKQLAAPLRMIWEINAKLGGIFANAGSAWKDTGTAAGERLATVTGQKAGREVSEALGQLNDGKGGGLPSIDMSGMVVSTAVGQTNEDIAAALADHVEVELVDRLRRRSAGGAAPVSKAP